MKTILVSIAATSVLAVCAAAQTPHFTVTDLGTLGGPGTNSAGLDINNAGWVGGSSNLIAGGPQHAFLWYGGSHMTDLGTLGGRSCPACNSAADGPNGSGEAAIGSETSAMDPNGEDFCEYGTHRQCLGAIWKNGTLIALPNLTGGNNANAFALNDQGQVAGFAENGTPDGTCATPFQVRRFEAVIWGRDDNIRGLPPLKGDTVGFAFGINDIGQVIGASGLCANTTIPPNPSGAHAVLWENGTPTDLGNLGGTSTVASSINNRGQVVGGAQSAADGTTHAFLWSRNTGMLDLGAFPGAIATVAPCCNTINDRGTVVGFAIDGTDFSSRALIWVDKKMMDLNTLITANSGWYLQGALSINDAGEITGYGTIGGEVHAFLARPK